MLTITRNDIIGGFKGVLAGPNCRVDIRNNTFSGHNWSIRIPDNGNKPNKINCNIFDDVRIGTTAAGINESTVFFENDYFNMVPGGAETQLAKTNPTNPFAPKAKIFSPQGGQNNPSDNCFDQNAGTDFLAPVASAEHFTYYYAAEAEPGSCLIPTVGNNNYNIIPTLDNNDHVCIYSTPNELGGEPPYTKAQLIQLRSMMDIALADWQSNLNDLSKGTNYYKLLEAKSFVMDWLLRHYLDNANLSEAENILLEENNQSARQELLGLKASRNDWAGMSTVLATYPVNNQDDAWFVQVQQINLARLSSPVPFTLNASQESLLYQVALSHSPVRGFARGLIALLKGEYILDEDPEDVIELPEERSSDEQISQFSLFPNPANEVVTLMYPNTLANVHVELFDIFGQPVAVHHLDQSGIFSFSSASLPVGIYTVKLLANETIKYVAKLVITH